MQLDKMLALRGERRLNDLRDACSALAPSLGLAAEFGRLDGIVAALLGTHTARKLSARQSLARVAGRPYDPDRLELFDALFSVLNREVFAAITDQPQPALPASTSPFSSLISPTPSKEQPSPSPRLKASCSTAGS